MRIGLAVVVVLISFALLDTAYNGRLDQAQAVRRGCRQVSQRLVSAIEDLHGDIANLRGDVTNLRGDIASLRAAAAANKLAGRATTPTTGQLRAARRGEAHADLVSERLKWTSIAQKQTSIRLKIYEIELADRQIDVHYAAELSVRSDRQLARRSGFTCKRANPDPPFVRLW